MMPVWLKTTLRLTSIVAVVSVVSVVVLIVFRNLVDLGPLHDSSEAIGTYLQVLGGIYAVLLAFVVVIVWGHFNEARGYVNREAQALVDLYRIAGAMPDDAREVIQQGLRDYLDGVIADEWHAMAKRDQRTIDKVGQRLDRVWYAVHSCTPTSENQRTIYGELLSRFNALSEIRTNRLTAAATRIPTAMHVLLYTGAVLMVASIYLMPFIQFWLHATVTAALAGATAHILFLIHDLDDAFEGDYQVDRSALVRARQRFDARTPDP